ncbi:hypothetical protein BZG02_20615 [Labilibaculum filiforme]|uniref:Uncharacterized protein n=2 Tax=Labilibaculum filiforme TaxID=1940526 RepID=A0A2N3HQ08_9BACT|nr:hypothetical protein BZG02_20615 [Labilibaculum filiforme]
MKIMKIKQFIYGIAMTGLIVSCVSQSDYDKVLAENEKLKLELEDCQHGAEKLIANVEKAYSEKNYSFARENIDLLANKHPESPKNKDFEILLKSIEKAELIEKKKKEAEEKERIRLENLNNTGMWSVRYYVDEFGEKTNQGYISNSLSIKGSFSNTATQDSRLNVDFLISNSSKISFQLYEYAGNNPVKAYSSESYRVLIQDKDGNRHKLTATNYSDRLSFDKTSSRKVHGILMKGGTIKFKVVEIDTPTTEYDFTIQKADWYDNAYKKLKES